MARFLGLLFLLFISSATACDRCVYQSKASHLYESPTTYGGACGYGNLESSTLHTRGWLVNTQVGICWCEWKNRVIIHSTWAIKFLYQGGQTDIVAVDVAQVGTSNWSHMKRNYGAVWETDNVPEGALQLRMVVTSGYDGKWLWAKSVLLVDWRAGVIYNSGIQIADIAKESCPPWQCGDLPWK